MIRIQENTRLLQRQTLCYCIKMLTLLIIFGIGLIIGSFANMLIYRLPRGMNWIHGTSHCTQCQTPLKPWQLVPILGYSLQKGCCKSCHNPIPRRYLWVEILMSLGFAALFVLTGPTLLFLKLAAFYFFTLCIFFTDLETTLIPDGLSYTLLASGLIFSIKTQSLPDSLSGALTGFIIFFFIWSISRLIYKKDAMGIGDIKLATGMGSYWGWQHTVLTAYGSFVIGAIVGLYLIFVLKRSRKDMMPFGPAMILSAYVMLAFGDWFWNRLLTL